MDLPKPLANTMNINSEAVAGRAGELFSEFSKMLLKDLVFNPHQSYLYGIGFKIKVLCTSLTQVEVLMQTSLF
jgi:hypothetical protein